MVVVAGCLQISGGCKGANRQVQSCAQQHGR